MKERILKWALNKVYDNVSIDKDTLLKKIGELLDKLAPLYIDNSLEKDIYKLIFNSMYKEDVKDTLPHDLLNSFYKKANKGDSSFKADPFIEYLGNVTINRLETLNIDLVEMKIKDITIMSTKSLKAIIEDKDITTLLVKNTNFRTWILFNTRTTIKFGYHQEDVIKGISENGSIFNMTTCLYSLPESDRNPSNYLLIPYEACDKEDKAFLDIKRNKILEKINEKATRRKLMSADKQEK